MLVPDLMFSGFDRSALGIAMSTVEGTSSQSGSSLSSTTTQPTVTASLFNRGVIRDALCEILDDISAFRALVDAGDAGGGPLTSSSVSPSSSGGSVPLEGGTVSPYECLSSFPWDQVAQGDKR